MEIKTYKTATGYAKRVATGEILKAETLFLGVFDSPDNYADATEAEWKAYEAKREREMEEERLKLERGIVD